MEANGKENQPKIKIQTGIIKKSTRQVTYDREPDPLTLFECLGQKGKGFLFESADRCGDMGRYSLIGLDPILEVKALGRQVTLAYGDKTEVFEADPFEVIKRLVRDFDPVPQKIDQDMHEGVPFNQGGLAGYIGYDAVGHIETTIGMELDQKPSGDGLDDIHLILPQHLLVIDREDKVLRVIEFGLTRLDGTGEIQTDAGKDKYKPEINDFMETLSKVLLQKELKEVHEVQASQKGQKGQKGQEGKKKDAKAPNISKYKEKSALELSEKWSSDLDQEGFEKYVRTAKDHIAKGDAFQIVFSRRLEKETHLSGLDLYKTLRRLNPSPYMFLVSTGKTEIVGASPETMVNLKNGRATIHPIAGTRPRGRDEKEDLDHERNLTCDVKENAEHLMLVDLARNDIGRISKPGTVNVPKYKSIERFSHVMHIVSEVVGQVEKDTHAVDVFKACFPAGTVSGAPKVKAMSILAENEKVKRGVYAGAVGWIGIDGNMDTCIAIRTAVLHKGRVHIQAGGGIVQDSDPHMEFMETLHKSASVMRAVELAEDMKHIKNQEV